MILPGCFLAWQSGRERSRLEARYERMVRIAGDLPIEDPSMVYVSAVDTGEPLHYAWHFHLPPNYSLILRNETGGGSGGSSTSSSTGSRDFIGRVRFQPDEQGLLTVYTHFDGSSGMMGSATWPSPTLSRPIGARFASSNSAGPASPSSSQARRRCSSD